MDDRDALVVTVLPGTSRFADDDPRRSQEATELADELRRTGSVVVPPAPDRASKGAVETAGTITVLIGSLSAVRYAVEAFRIWVERDAKREAELQIRTGPNRQSVHISLKGFNSETLLQVLEDARERQRPH